MVKIIFSNLACFKEYDNVLAEVYGFIDASFNPPFLIDSLETLGNILGKAVSPLDPSVICLFDRECINKMEIVIDIILKELQDDSPETKTLFKNFNVSNYN
jgi:hypothetical protein